MTAFLKCEVSPGMFSHERGVTVATSDGRNISGFFPVECIDEEKQLLKVEIIEAQFHKYLVRVPGFPADTYGFIGTTSAIWVPKSAIVI
jgi:hypothetical protein